MTGRGALPVPTNFCNGLDAPGQHRQRLDHASVRLRSRRPPARRIWHVRFRRHRRDHLAAAPRLPPTTTWPCRWLPGCNRRCRHTARLHHARVPGAGARLPPRKPLNGSPAGRRAGLDTELLQGPLDFRRRAALVPAPRPRAFPVGFDASRSSLAHER